MYRAINIYINPENIATALDGGGQFAKCLQEVHAAIAYLCMWGGTGYDHVNIYADGDVNMVAHYTNEDNPRTYTIGAVWHDDHYGFHS